MTGQRRRKGALSKGLPRLGGEEGHAERHNQAADDQNDSSGKVQLSPNVFAAEERFSSRGYVRFLPTLNKPWNLATARRKALSDTNNCANRDELG